MSKQAAYVRSVLQSHPRVLSAAFGATLILSQAIVYPTGNGGVIS